MHNKCFPPLQSLQFSAFRFGFGLFRETTQDRRPVLTVMGLAIRGRWIQSQEEDRYYMGQVQGKGLKMKSPQGQG